ncbi:hypothetical protein BABINDRAFT_18391, partial [Babjeviella inositovora NRRL Y-12698]
QTSSDPTTLADTLASAGVDLREEEALLSSTIQIPFGAEADVAKIVSSLFLEHRQLAPFMRMIARDNGVKQTFDQEPDILGTMSAACEHWLSHVVTKTALLARHRKRTTKKSSTLNRNHTPTALRELAYKQKAEEDARSQKRIQLGIETALDLLQRAGAEETLHRATNSTASMMTGAKRRKYAWLSNGANAGAGTGGRNSNVRGDTGLRFRENRYSRGIVLRDVLEAMDGERMGVDKSIVKGYAKLRD